MDLYLNAQFCGLPEFRISQDKENVRSLLWQKWYEKQFHRIQKCIDHCGEDFERQ